MSSRAAAHGQAPKEVFNKRAFLLQAMADANAAFAPALALMAERHCEAMTDFTGEVTQQKPHGASVMTSDDHWRQIEACALRSLRFKHVMLADDALFPATAWRGGGSRRVFSVSSIPTYEKSIFGKVCGNTCRSVARRWRWCWAAAPAARRWPLQRRFRASWPWTHRSAASTPPR